MIQRAYIFLYIDWFPGLLEAPSLPPQLSIETVSYKIFLTGKPAIGKTSMVAKLLGQGEPLYYINWQSFCRVFNFKLVTERSLYS